MLCAPRRLQEAQMGMEMAGDCSPIIRDMENQLLHREKGLSLELPIIECYNLH